MDLLGQLSSNVVRIAGAVAEADRTLTSGLLVQQGERSGASTGPEAHQSPSGTASAGAQSSGEHKRRFPITSAIRKRRKSMPDYKPMKPATCYIQDIMCLPRSYRNVKSENVPIPRTERRNTIAEAGLIGKVEFRSDMTDQEGRQEICKVFASPMGLTKTAIEQGDLFPFTYLQCTGPGSRTLCVPSVSSDFQWDGKKSLTLAKSGGIIYILADSHLPEINESSESSSDELPDTKVTNGSEETENF